MDFFTADLCDKYQDEVQVLEPGFISYGGTSKCSGKIATVRLEDNNQELIKLLQSDGHNKIAVVDVSARFVAVVGDKLMSLAQKNSWAGIVVNGYVRDTTNTKEFSVGLFALGTCPKKAPNPNTGEIGATLHFKGVTFQPEEYLYADTDGIITAKNPLYM